MSETELFRLPLTDQFFMLFIANCPNAIIGVDRQGMVSLFNEAAETVTGWKAEQVIGKMHCSQIYHPPKLGRWIKKMLYSPERGGVGRIKNLEVTLRTREGQTVPILLTGVLLQENGKEIGSVGFFHDLTRTRQLEQISITDNLTGLYNRYHFHTVLARELGLCQRYRRPLTMIYFDLDNFKPFNDSFGHNQGDGVLRLVGDCAKRLLRLQDYAFRVGGDEFALLLVETDLSSGALVAERFRTVFNDQWVETMVGTEAGLRPVSLSLGVAEYDQAKDSNDTGEKADNFIMRADMAMYEAKRRGGDRVVKAGAYIELKDDKWRPRQV